MAHTSTIGLYLLATLLFLSGVDHSLAQTNDAAENIPRAVHTKDPSKEDRLELAIQSVMRAVEDGLARAAREVREIKEEVKSLEDGIKSSLEEKLSNAVDTITSSVTDIVNAAMVCLTKPDPKHANCHDLLQRGHSSSGLYCVTISGKMVKVYCDMTTDGGGWTVIQRRDDIQPHVDFDRGWADYKRGFGDLEGEFWLGLDNIHGLTRLTGMQLRVELEDWEGEERVASYRTFVVGGEEEKYKLTVGGYGKGPGGGDPGDYLASHNGRAFSTRDSDNDGYSGNCAERSKGGWWYNACLASNLNGLYLKGEHGQWDQGVIWGSIWKRTWSYSLRRSAMKIRPR